MTDEYNEEQMFPKLFWEEYVADRCSTDEQKENANKIYEFLLSNEELWGITGEQLQEDYSYFKDIEGLNIDFSYTWRSWGSLMSAFMNEQKGERIYHYMSFYM
jgi:hypothetical protein